MKQSTSIKKKSATTAPAAFVQPHCTFGHVLTIVSSVEGLTPGVRQNLEGAVIRCAKLMSSAGLRAVVNVPSIAKRLEKLSPARLGFKNKGSLAAFKSHLRRALAARWLHDNPRPPYNPVVRGLDGPSSADQRSSPTAAALSLHARGFRARLAPVRDQRHACDAISATPVVNMPEKQSRQDSSKYGAAWNAAVATIKGWPGRHLEVGPFLRLEIHTALDHVSGQLSTRCRRLRQSFRG